MIDFMIFQKLNQNYSEGFSIMEIIVVIFIISLGLVGVLSLIMQNIRVEQVNKNMLIASQLAQEGLELVRNKRDTNWLNGDDWETGDGANPDTDIIQDGDYAIDYTGQILDVDDIEDPDAKLYEVAGNFLRHYIAPPDDSSFTGFFRMITADTDTSNASTTFQCLVQWENRGTTYQYMTETVLYDWLSAS